MRPHRGRAKPLAPRTTVLTKRPPAARKVVPYGGDSPTAEAPRLDKRASAPGAEPPGSVLARTVLDTLDMAVACAAVRLGAAELPGPIGAARTSSVAPAAPVPSAPLVDEAGTLADLGAARESARLAATKARLAAEGLTLDRQPPKPSMVERAVSADGHEAWFSTDWFLADRTGAGDGDPRDNLWAKGGVLDKVDRVGGPGSGAAAHERQLPAMFDVGIGALERGGALASGRISERAFNHATSGALHEAVFGRRDVVTEHPLAGFDFLDGEGRSLLGLIAGGAKIRPVLDGQVLEHRLVRRGRQTIAQLLDAGGRPLGAAPTKDAYFAVVTADGALHGDGRIEGAVQADWFGHCDATSLAALLFDRPQRGVAINGVDFTPQDIEGLLTLVAAELPVQMEFVGDRFAGDDQAAPIAPWTLRETVLEWAMSGGGIADVGIGGRIFNRPFTSAADRTYDERPLWANEPAPDEPKLDPSLKRSWGELTIDFADTPRTYRYWMATDDAGEPVAGGYYDPPPGFLWKPKSLDLDWPERLARNPHVPIALVEALYENSVDS